MMTRIRKYQGVAAPSWLVFVIDVLCVAASVWIAYLIRFNFSIPASELEPFPGILFYMVIVRIIFLLVSKSYTMNLHYMNFMDILKIYLYTVLGSLVFLLSDVVSYFFISNTLFIPLTIIILEFLSTSFLFILLRGVVRVNYASESDQQKAEKLKN